MKSMILYNFNHFFLTRESKNLKCRLTLFRIHRKDVKLTSHIHSQISCSSSHTHTQPACVKHIFSTVIRKYFYTGFSIIQYIIYLLFYKKHGLGLLHL